MKKLLFVLLLFSGCSSKTVYYEVKYTVPGEEPQKVIVDYDPDVLYRSNGVVVREKLTNRMRFNSDTTVICRKLDTYTIVKKKVLEEKYDD